MRAASKCLHCWSACIGVMLCAHALAQTQSTGRLAGTVRDTQGAAIASAKIEAENLANGEKRTAACNDTGGFALLSLPPGAYHVTAQAAGFEEASFPSVTIALGDTTSLSVTLRIAHTSVQVNVNDDPPLVRTDGVNLETAITADSLSNLPTPAANVLQLLTTAPGVSAPIQNNNAIGRDSPNVSVNGARVTQSSYQINGVDANDIAVHAFDNVAVPALQAISEVKVLTSMYDASVGGAGGGSIQLVTRSGTNAVHASVYEYFQNEALNANDPNLKAVGERRPVLKRNVFGGTLGGPLRKSRAFYFVSYEGRRESNGATDQSLYKDVLLDPCLTNDRSAATLMASCGVPTVDSAALKLLNFRLPDGRFLIPTPQSNGLVTGTALSTYREDQFNTNVDFRAGSKDAFTGKFFFANAPLFSALGASAFGTGPALPGFGTEIQVNNRVLALQEIHTFSPNTVNEFRLGYNFIRSNEVPHEPLLDSDLNISRVSAAEFPGLPLFILQSGSGASFGTNEILLRGISPSLSLMDSVSLQRGRHYLRLGGEVRRSQWNVHGAVASYGEIDFASFQDFLSGNSAFSVLGTGSSRLDLRTNDYHLFAQDDWRATPSITLSLGLRYELNAPPYDTHGELGGFDTALYKPRMEVDADGFPVGPPAGGIIEAGNAPVQYSLPGVTRVGKRVLKNLDSLNFAPRVGIAWSPLRSSRFVLHAGYGVFYSRPSFLYVGLNYFAPPFFQISAFGGQPLQDPFPGAPPSNSFPIVQTGISLGANVVDRNNRNPYYQQFNTGVQYEILRDTVVQAAYAGSRGLRLLRSLSVNQARIASVRHPIVNSVTGETFTTNTAQDAALRAPLQGVDTGAFALNQSSAQSTYHSLQATLNRRMSRGLQVSLSYTFSKSIDDTSNPGGGANLDGTPDRGGGLDTGSVWGDILDPRANRGLSDFDRTHMLAFTYVWNLPTPAFLRKFSGRRAIFSNWQISGSVLAMSGLPVDILDFSGASVYGLFGARPNWAPGADPKSAFRNVPAGYYFNPKVFRRAQVDKGQAIPSAHDPTALAGDTVTDFGDVGRNVLRGPRQTNFDFSVAKHFPWSESRDIAFRAEFFNVLNHPSRDNPVSDINLANFDEFGHITDPGTFGRVPGFDSSPRVVQFSLHLTF
jgi:Carboxypeptidase regulatory-like domain/TonB-dependent Receptor Plug Domain